jgi:hypothetical protein
LVQRFRIDKAKNTLDLVVASSEVGVDEFGYAFTNLQSLKPFVWENLVGIDVSKQHVECYVWQLLNSECEDFS